MVTFKTPDFVAKMTEKHRGGKSGQITSAREEYYMRLALDQAHQALGEGEVPIGAVLVSEGDVIAQAHNMPISLNDPTCVSGPFCRHGLPQWSLVLLTLKQGHAVVSMRSPRHREHCIRLR